MKRYLVKTTTQADEHVLEYAEYIRDELMNPKAARKFVNDIRTAVKSLNSMPQRNPLTDKKPWCDMGIRRMPVRGYIVYYRIVEDISEVHVVGVVYGKRNQIEQLADMNLEQ